MKISIQPYNSLAASKAVNMPIYIFSLSCLCVVIVTWLITMLMLTNLSFDGVPQKKREFPLVTIHTGNSTRLTIRLCLDIRNPRYEWEYDY